MLNRINGWQELEQVDMFIRAISDEMAQSKTHSVENTVRNTLEIEMEEALFELRLRKLLMSAEADSNRNVSH